MYIDSVYCTLSFFVYKTKKDTLIQLDVAYATPQQGSKKRLLHIFENYMKTINWLTSIKISYNIVPGKFAAWQKILKRIGLNVILVHDLCGVSPLGQAQLIPARFTHGLPTVGRLSRDWLALDGLIHMFCICWILAGTTETWFSSSRRLAWTPSHCRWIWNIMFSILKLKPIVMN